jgi:hypothetical protein
MTPFKALYGHRCCTPLNWIKPGKRMIFGPDLVTEAKEIVFHIQSNLKSFQGSTRNLCQQEMPTA